MQSRTHINDELEAGKKRAKKEQIFSVLFLLALLCLIPLFSSGNEGAGLLTWENRTLLISLPNGISYTVPYEDIQELSLVEAPDFGSCTEGESTETLRWGTWYNDTLGEYILCTYRSFDVVIHVKTAQHVFWIGYESTETTRILYQSFLEHWQNP